MCRSLLVGLREKRGRKKRKSVKLGVFIKLMYLRGAPKIVNMRKKNPKQNNKQVK